MMTREIPQELAEMMAVNALIKFVDKYDEWFSTGEVDPKDDCGFRAKLIEDMLWVFYKDKRQESPIREPDALLSNQELVDFITDEALFHIQAENPLFLRRNWDGSYEIITDDELF